jgi:hypothetical protein
MTIEGGGDSAADRIEQVKRYVGRSVFPDTDSLRNAVSTYEEEGLDTSELESMALQTVVEAHHWLLSKFLETKDVRYLQLGIGNNQGYEVVKNDEEARQMLLENYNLCQASDLSLDEMLEKTSEQIVKIQAYKDAHPYNSNNDYFSFKEKLGVDVKTAVRDLIVDTFNRKRSLPDTPECKEMLERLNSEGLTQAFFDTAERLNEIGSANDDGFQGTSKRSAWAVAMAVKKGRELLAAE